MLVASCNSKRHNGRARILTSLILFVDAGQIFSTSAPRRAEVKADVLGARLSRLSCLKYYALTEGGRGSRC